MKKEDFYCKSEKKPRVYISGPISGHDKETCIKEFDRIECMLKAQGYRVFNPLENGLEYDAPTHRHMRRDLNVLTNEEDPFSFIYMKRKWLHSAGCKIEFDAATASGISVMFEEFDGNVHIIKFE